ncbi:MAG: heparan-alpha-glucosaminide N-acetyltransferase [Desulfotomaculales bacterium]
MRFAQERFWEIDFLRGVAVLMMVTYHVLFDLAHFGRYPIDVTGGFWLYFARATAVLFLLLVGVSLTLSHSAARRRNPGARRLYLRYLGRGVKLFAWGMAVTLVTYLFVGEGFVVFGILHLIGVAVVLAYPLLRLGVWNLLPGVGLVVLGLYLQKITAPFFWLVWLGLAPRGFYSLDYFPVLPWFGVVVLGLFLGHLLYPNRVPGVAPAGVSGFLPVAVILGLGRHSLAAYLAHQPLILLVLQVLGVPTPLSHWAEFFPGAGFLAEPLAHQPLFNP